LRVAIIGTGLIGASLGLALQELLEVETVVGYDRDADRLATALNRGAMASVGLDAADAVSGADVVVLAVPASAMAAIAGEIAGSLETGAIVTDVASVKTGVVSTLQQLLPDDVWLVGGHPMAGSHEEGPEHASADLFVGATYLLTPNLASEQARRQHAGLLLLAAGGFRDATRVAASNPDLWLDICAENRDAIVAVLDDYAARIEQLRETVATADNAELHDTLLAAQRARRALPRKSVRGGALIELTLPIPDRPGVLAEVTTSVGAAGVNIEDFSIDHAAEGGRGALRLIIAGAATAAAATAALKERGYEVRERRL
jgi:prephenate dehydrogenase